ncbi:MAG: hypothetical protein GAK28_01528 [Luteibacter sp.]|uniref:fimbrial protein n=1 Tax=Luteibacter sp. TaxID=1886636 RepID=UPI001385357F|nr:fimbrial protein [Luteibacter sp.]KAF1008051.1 MAG: hypothetical protein GAK28_01528 [Luteibacter sp.]
MPMPFISRHRAVPALALLALAGTTNHARACVKITPPSIGLYARANVANDEANAPLGTPLSDWAKTPSFVYSGCTSSLPLALRTQFAGGLGQFVTYVNLEGQRYAAFQVYANSPLFIFRQTVIAENSGRKSTLPVGEFELNHPGILPDSSGTLASYFEMRTVGRGSPIQPATSDELHIFRFNVTPPSFPALKGYADLNSSIQVVQPTCEFLQSEQSVKLPDIRMLDLGSTSASVSFYVNMKCNVYRSFRIRLTDKLDPGNNNTALTPTPTSTAQGVRLQVLRNDVPFPMQGTWDFRGYGGGSYQYEQLAVRYVRTSGTLVPGTIGAMITITTNYL